jgi:hypothetical protein
MKSCVARALPYGFRALDQARRVVVVIDRSSLSLDAKTSRSAHRKHAAHAPAVLFILSLSACDRRGNAYAFHEIARRRCLLALAFLFEQGTLPSRTNTPRRAGKH